MSSKTVWPTEQPSLDTNKKDKEKTSKNQDAIKSYNNSISYDMVYYYHVTTTQAKK